MNEIRSNLVGGEWISGQDAGDNVNPSNTRDIVGIFAGVDGSTTIDAAVEAAAATFPTWSTTSSQRRFDVLDAAGTEILEPAA